MSHLNVWDMNCANKKIVKLVHISLHFDKLFWFQNSNFAWFQILKKMRLFQWFQTLCQNVLTSLLASLRGFYNVKPKCFFGVVHDACILLKLLFIALTPLIKILPKSFSCHFAFNVKVLAEIKYCKSLMYLTTFVANGNTSFDIWLHLLTYVNLD